ncbi:Hypothetical Protein FCC1311_086802 [Hondaea fermentalgiana]|uniref:Uncharacterized protein n=1 Tax=Hondaea fermentalgiana TaxID=2315210 RepID=A0A2R5GPB4_9STRA|nr:Hypothetical Protein FCC1311_086802 [Hondaea fermentalgiana]|eukprot:GBG32455.1 Hypothetical Protein FCC1311_086802 [Hondaea fermentalgiana]
MEFDDLGGGEGFEDMDVDMAGLGEEEDDLGGVEDEVDRKTAVALVEALRDVVRQRLGALEQGFGAEFEGPTEVGTNKKASKTSSSTTTSTTNEGADTTASADDETSEGPSRLVESARALAALNASTLDGAEGPGAAVAQFRETCANLRQFVTDPYKKSIGAMDPVRRARARDQLRDFGDKSGRLKSLTTRAKRLKDYAKVQRDERSLGFDRKYGVHSLCLPSQLFKLAQDLRLDFMNDLEDEKKIYISHGQYLLVEVMYSNEGEISLNTQLVNESGDATALVDEASDILESLKHADRDGEIHLLHAKIRALIRRSDLEVALKAGSLHDLSKDAEAALMASQGGVKRVARGIEASMGPRPVAAGYLSRLDAAHVSPLRDASKILRAPQGEAGAPPCQLSDANGTAGASGNDAVAQGAVLALLLSPRGRLPIKDVALQTPPRLDVCVNVRANGNPRTNRIRIRIDPGPAVPSQMKKNLASIVHQVSLHPSQHDQLVEILRRLDQQTRFNALLASAVFNTIMEVAPKSPSATNDESLSKRPKISASQDSGWQRRVLVCASRRERMLKAQRAPQSSWSLLGDPQMNPQAQAEASEHLDIDQERVVMLRAVPPRQFQVFEGENVVLDVTVPEQKSEPLQTVPSDISSFLEASPSLPMALAKIFGYLD